MIKIHKLQKYIGNRLLFEEVSFILGDNEKVGLVGPNGGGKSTLLKIICGEIEADGGSIENTDETFGYVPQELVFEPQTTLEDFLFPHPQHKQKRILSQVGLENIPLDFHLEKLSGGQKTRLSLARALLENPSVLLLDEPTNHLDTKGVEWLENFIKNFRGAVFVVSHDRKLLDVCVEKIFELDPTNHAFHSYEGNYSDYILAKEKRMNRWMEDYERQQKEKRRLETRLALKRQEASVYSDPAKGKQVRAMERRIQREIYDQEISRPNAQKQLKRVELKGETSSSKLILRAKNVSKSFEDTLLFSSISFEIRGKERVILQGENGSGKTTLLKILSGELNPDTGEVQVGENVRFHYFRQEHESLDPNKTVLESFLSASSSHVLKTNPRSILGSFLFRGEDVNKKVSYLSLGERVRLIFAQLTTKESELLILDEPTNHLDLASREVIEKALMQYEGALLVVSHDRYFIEKISPTRTLLLEDGVLRD